ncbi:MAG: hypothetical protein HXX20_16190 [Chloroflexi bacterium]|nr:hypothetical protein [Chloroflexota bacterium]
MSSKDLPEISDELRDKIDEVYKSLAAHEGDFKTKIEAIQQKTENDFDTIIVDELAASRIEHLQESDKTFKPYATDLLILLVGHALEPLKLSIAIHRPRYLALVYSSEVKDSFNKLGNFLQGQVRKWPTERSKPNPVDKLKELSLRIDSSKPKEIFEGMQVAWREIWSKQEGVAEGRVALDITGGKKTMLAGAFQFAAVTPFLSAAQSGPFPLYYMDFDDYDSFLRRPDLTSCYYRRISDAITLYQLQAERNREVSKAFQFIPTTSFFKKKPEELNNGELFDLAGLLHKCQSMSDRANRETIVRLLRDEIKHRIERNSGTMLDTINILLTCRTFEGGLIELLKMVKEFEGGSLNWVEVEAWTQIQIGWPKETPNN